MERNLGEYIQQQSVPTSAVPVPGETSPTVSGQPVAAPNITDPVGQDLGQPGVTTQPPAAPVPQIDPQIVQQLLSDNQAMRNALQEENRKAQRLEEQAFQERVAQIDDPDERFNLVVGRIQEQAANRERALQTQLQTVQGTVNQALEQAAKQHFANRYTEQFKLSPEQTALLLTTENEQGMRTLAQALSQLSPAQSRQLNDEINANATLGDNPGSTPSPTVPKRQGRMQDYIASKSYQYGTE